MKTIARGILVVSGVALLSSPALAQRSLKLYGPNGLQVVVTGDAPTLAPEIDAKSYRVLVYSGPASLCEHPNYGKPCIIILNKVIGCELENCFPGAGNWKNRVRSVKFLPQRLRTSRTKNVSIQSNLPVSCINLQTYPSGQPGLVGISMDNYCGAQAHVLWNVFTSSGQPTELAGWWCQMSANEHREAYYRTAGRGERPRILSVRTGNERCPQ
jgi:hypothetical protein